MGITNEQLREMANEAMNYWDFDAETDPDGSLLRGLQYIASDGDFRQSAIDAQFGGKTDDSKWDALDEWARFYGAA